MPNTASAKKALRQNIKRAARNKVIKAELKSLRVKVRKLVTAKDHAGATETARLLGKKLDKAQGKNVLKKNTVARIKSRMMKTVNAIAKKA